MELVSPQAKRTAQEGKAGTANGVIGTGEEKNQRLDAN